MKAIYEHGMIQMNLKTCEELKLAAKLGMQLVERRKS